MTDRGPEDKIDSEQPELGRSESTVALSFAKVQAAARAYWHSQTPQERLTALELMRQTAYGYDPATTRLQRVLEITQFKRIGE